MLLFPMRTYAFFCFLIHHTPYPQVTAPRLASIPNVLKETDNGVYRRGRREVQGISIDPSACSNALNGVASAATAACGEDSRH
jgi:hypothetical protein